MEPSGKADSNGRAVAQPWIKSCLRRVWEERVKVSYSLRWVWPPGFAEVPPRRVGGSGGRAVRAVWPNGRLALC